MYEKNKETEFLIEQNKILIEQNKTISSTSLTLIKNINFLSNKLSYIEISYRISNNNNMDSNEINNEINTNNNNNNFNNDENIINIIFKLNDEKINVYIDSNKKFLDAIKILQTKKISCSNLNKMIIRYNSINITERVKAGEIISELGIISNTEVSISFTK